MKSQANGITFNCRIDGAEGAPWLMLSNSLATNLSMWDGQTADFAQHYRVLRYDQRGHGASDAPAGDYDFDMLADDAAALMQAHGIEACHFLGLSMGGMTAMGLGLNHPERVRSLTICNSRADVTPEFRQIFDARIAIAFDQGMEALVETTVERWFTENLRATEPAFLDDVRDMVRTTPPEGYAGCARAVQSLDYMARLKAIDKPVLFIAGAQDIATPPERMRAMQAAIAGSDYVELDPASHLSNLEQPQAFTAAVREFLARRG
ncbi:MAG: 3-oxoadipate enol-lactonase [Alphaproteobacteria bacterium]|nr:3-oxoadipate enol-lactonase [Alphaproteobacteria bacterium]